jgi:hypothetical protein
VEASPPQLSADLLGRPFATNANASGPNFDALSIYIYWQDEHDRRNCNG